MLNYDLKLSNQRESLSKSSILKQKTLIQITENQYFEFLNLDIMKFSF